MNNILARYDREQQQRRERIEFGLLGDRPQMVSELIQIFQTGQDVVTGVGDVRAALTLYSWGGITLGKVKQYFGAQQEENIKAISERAQKYLNNIPDDKKTIPPASITAPLIEAAMQESREELQDLWAALLASAMLEEGRKVRYEFVEILKKLNPQDAVAFKILGSLPNAQWSNPATDPNPSYIKQQLMAAGLSQDEWVVSIDNLRSCPNFCVRDWISLTHNWVKDSRRGLFLTARP